MTQYLRASKKASVLKETNLSLEFFCLFGTPKDRKYALIQFANL